MRLNIKRYFGRSKTKRTILDVDGNPIVDFKGNYLDIDEKAFKKYASAVENFYIRVDSLSGLLTVQKVFSLLENAYYLAENWIQFFSPHCPCQVGCSACCNEMFPVYSIEAEYIRHYVLNNIDEPEQILLKQSINTLHKPKVSQNTQCPFLSSKNLCSIYNARPLVCRTHIVITTPAEDCSKRMGRPLESDIPDLLIQSVDKLAQGYSKGLSLPIAMPFSKWFESGFRQRFI